MSKKVVIVGGMAVGASCATRLRRLDEEAKIVVFERGEHISFANCGTPYYIGDEIKDRDDLFLRTPEEMKALFDIDFRVNSEVVAVDTARKAVRVKGPGGEYEESYDFLVLAPGARAAVPPIPGVESKRIMTLRDIDDTDKIKAWAAEAKRVLIVGSGFIGVELAENLKLAGLSVALVDAAGQVLPPFDIEMANILTKELEDKGVEIYLKEKVTSFEDREDGLVARFERGREFLCDFAVLSLGVVPDTDFLSGSGIELWEKGYIKVDSRLRTNIENVYAAGDAILVKDFVSGQLASIPLAGPANKQGRIIADNICGGDVEYEGSLGTAIIKVFDLAGACVGNNEKMLRAQGVPYKAVYAHPASHASYYPGARQIALKLLFSPDDGRIFGAQAVGYEGVDKRIDVIATVMRLKGTVKDLEKLELAYSPPYSSAKDPVNMLGFIAENVMEGKMDVFTLAELEGLDLSKVTLLDIRSKRIFDSGHIEGAVHIPFDDIRQRYTELDKSKEIYIYCNVGWSAYNAGRFLMQKGFEVKNLTGGYRTYLHYTYRPRGSTFSIGDKVGSLG